MKSNNDGRLVRLLSIVVAIGTAGVVSPVAAAEVGEKNPFSITPQAVELVRSDEALSRLVERELFRDPVVASDQVQAQATAGVVTLRGTVTTLLAKGRATLIARDTPNVKLVINELKIRSSSAPSDPQIRGSILSEFETNRDPVRFEQVQVAPDSGVAFLSGNVQSQWISDRAARIAQSAPGVVAVRNDLRVLPEMRPTDAVIRAGIDNSFYYEGLIDPQAIHVTIRDGRVWLRGTAYSPAQRAQAVQAAWVAGATSVDASELAVAGPAPRVIMPPSIAPPAVDDEIRQNVLKALAENERVKRDDIRADVVDGMVTLRGTVASLDEQKIADAVAHSAFGVREVVDQLTVGPLLTENDRRIREQILGLIRQNAGLASASLTVSVSDGVVHLSGATQSQADILRAAELALRVPGVTGIRSDLAVRPSIEMGQKPIPMRR